VVKKKYEKYGFAFCMKKLIYKTQVIPFLSILIKFFII
jgi:hypothetical protein